MFQDEARFGRITDPRRCWAPFPMRPICKAMLTREYTYAYAAVNVKSGVLDTLIFPFANTQCMQIFLDEVAERHSDSRIVMIMDGAGWHRSQTLKTPKNMVLIKLPPYSPELNPVENLWDELREKFFGNVIFDSLKKLESHLEASLKNFESRIETIRSIVAWPWIINSLSN
jgi:transposase